jgi:hypothetical protein
MRKGFTIEQLRDFCLGIMVIATSGLISFVIITLSNL